MDISSVKKYIKGVVFFLLFSLSVGCASKPERREPPPDFPRDAVMFQYGFNEAFERIVRALETQGYQVAFADRRSGRIETYPKEMTEVAQGAVQYRGVYMIRVDGDDDRSWGIIRFALLPELPGEREKLIGALQGTPPPPEPTEPNSP